MPACPKTRGDFQLQWETIFKHCCYLGQPAICFRMASLRAGKGNSRPFGAYWRSPTQPVRFAKGVSRYFPCLPHMRRLPA
uniref:Uncharacterized protein n=1 Tax=Caudovirales sp. ctUL28 TaxID=2826778 RepID=A0A8S5MVY2_9CAUD|nr:MAG TPA: hypothetical protein [Caudovirales sp. ctUL28]